MRFFQTSSAYLTKYHLLETNPKRNNFMVN